MISKITFFTPLVLLVLIKHSEQQTNDPAFKQNFNTITTACAQQYGLTLDYINGLIASPNPLPADDNLKCYFNCTNIKLGVMDANGNVFDDVFNKVATEFFNATIVADVDKDCEVPKQSNPCDTAFAMMACIHKDARK